MKKRRSGGRYGAVTAWPGSTLVVDVGAAVLGVIGFGVAQGLGTFLAEADRFDLVGIDAQQGHHACHGIRTALAQSQIIFGAAAGVGVAFHANLLALVAGQVVGMHLDDAAVLFGHRVAV